MLRGESSSLSTSSASEISEEEVDRPSQYARRPDASVRLVGVLKKAARRDSRVAATARIALLRQAIKSAKRRDGASFGANEQGEDRLDALEACAKACKRALKSKTLPQLTRHAMAAVIPGHGASPVACELYAHRVASAVVGERYAQLVQRKRLADLARPHTAKKRGRKKKTPTSDPAPVEPAVAPESIG